MNDKNDTNLKDIYLAPFIQVFLIYLSYIPILSLFPGWYIFILKFSKLSKLIWMQHLFI